MKISAYMTDGEVVTIDDLDDETVLPLIDALGNDDISVLALNLEGVGMTYIMKRNLARIDVDPVS